MHPTVRLVEGAQRSSLVRDLLTTLGGSWHGGLRRGIVFDNLRRNRRLISRRHRDRGGRRSNGQNHKRPRNHRYRIIGIFLILGHENVTIDSHSLGGIGTNVVHAKRITCHKTLDRACQHRVGSTRDLGGVGRSADSHTVLSAVIGTDIATHLNRLAWGQALDNHLVGGEQQAVIGPHGSTRRHGIRAPGDLERGGNLLLSAVVRRGNLCYNGIPSGAVEVESRRVVNPGSHIARQIVSQPILNAHVFGIRENHGRRDGQRRPVIPLAVASEFHGQSLFDLTGAGNGSVSRLVGDSVVIQMSVRSKLPRYHLRCNFTVRAAGNLQLFVSVNSRPRIGYNPTLNLLVSLIEMMPSR